MEIIPGIHCIPHPIVNAYVYDDAELVLIDASIKGNDKKILDYIKNTMHRDPRDVKEICITHADFDHVGGLVGLKEATGATIVSHVNEADIITGKSIKEAKRLPLVARLFAPMLNGYKKCPHVETVDRMVENGDSVAGLQAIHVPGHSPGELAFYDPVRKALFSGDAVLTNTRGRVCGPMTMSTFDLDSAWRSIEQLKALDVEVLLPGHGKPTTKDVNEQLKALTRPEKK